MAQSTKSEGSRPSPDGGVDIDPMEHRSESSSSEPREPKMPLSAKLKSVWAKNALDIPTMATMFKGAIGPTIALAAYQSTKFADYYATSGYLVAIVTILSFPIMPRAKFLQHLFLVAVSISIAFATALLASYCCVKARSNSENVYDSSAAAVAGVWLFFLVYIVNTLRFKIPQLALPGIPTAIVFNIVLLYAPAFGTMEYAIAYAEKVCISMYTGLAIGLGVGLVIFPVNMRKVVTKEMTGYIMTIRKLMRVNVEFINSLETGDMFSRTPTGATDRPKRREAQDVKAVLAELTGLHAKLSMDISFAKREIAFGKLGADDFADIYRRLRVLLFSVVGFSSLQDVFERTTESMGWHDLIDDEMLANMDGSAEPGHAHSVQEWHQLSAILQAPFQHFVGHIDDGLAHILVTLEMMPQKKAVHDLESNGNNPNPGDAGFTQYYEKRMNDFKLKRSLLLDFCKLRGIELPPNFFDKSEPCDIKFNDWREVFPDPDQRERYRRQLYMVLWMDYLLESMGQNVLEFCQFADGRVESGKMKRKRLIFPAYKRLRKYWRDLLSTRADQFHDDTHDPLSSGGPQTTSVYLGDAYHLRRDPEHLHPTTNLERIGEQIRKIPHFFRSTESVFGFRAACATMSTAIIGLYGPSRTFYIGDRGFWAQIMVSFALAPTAAQSLLGFFLRLVGTFGAMITSLAIWYIVDGKVAGVLVLYCFVISWGFYVIFKMPTKTMAGMIFVVTNTLIVGYELQTDKIGKAAAVRSGQFYFPIYLLAPYRFATVAAGMFIAWIWSIFPFPLSEHAELRRDLASSLYLLANYNSITDEIVRARLRGEADLNDPKSPFNQLEKARNKIYAKLTMVLQSLRMHVAMLKFDIQVGGRFPKEIYVKLVNRIQNLFNFMTLIILASETFAKQGDKAAKDEEYQKSSQAQWGRDLRRLVVDANTSNRECTTLLAMLSGSVASGRPLPPYMQPPPPYALVKKLDAMDRNILSLQHIFEPGFAAFACLQIGTKCVSDDVTALLRDIKQLVGEMDFSFHTVAGTDSQGSSAEDISRKGSKNE